MIGQDAPNRSMALAILVVLPETLSLTIAETPAALTA